MTAALLPLLVEGGRVVNVCSRSGKLDRLFGGGGSGEGGSGGGGSGSGAGTGSPRSPRSPPVSDGCEVLRKKWTLAAEAGDFSAIDELASEFVAAVKEGTAGIAGWPRSMYGVSVREVGEERERGEREKRDRKTQTLHQLTFPISTSFLFNISLSLAPLAEARPRSATRAPSPCPSPKSATRNTAASS